MDALFYPSLSLPSAAWTNPNLLYFDQIGVIAPEGDHLELFDGPTRMLVRHGLVCPLQPDRYARDDTGDAEVISHLLGMAHGNPRTGDITQIHLGKIAFTGFCEELIALRLVWRVQQSDWLEGPRWIVDYIMTVLATRMALNPEISASLLTHQRFAERLVVATSSSATTKWRRRMRAVAQLLPIGPDAEIDAILRFREDHAEERRRFRGLIEGLLQRSPDGLDGEEDFEGRLRQAEEVRRHLEGELEIVRSEAPVLPIFLTATAMAAPTAEASYYSAAAAGASLLYVLAQRASAQRRRRVARADRMVYAALAANSFRARRSDDVLR